MKEIVCVSTSNYYPFPTRKQNVMNRMKDCRVIYFDPPVSLIAPLKDPKARERLSLWKKGGEKAKDNPHITVYASPWVFPFFNKLRFINRINQKRLAAKYAKIIKENGFSSELVIWCYSPSSCDLIEPLAKRLKIKPEKLWQNAVYDCVDRHSAYPGMINPAVVDKMEEDLASKCGQVFATAKGLSERLKAFNEKACLIPNGANYELFSRAAVGKPCDINSPVFGFVGMLQECIDYGALLKLAQAFPKGKLVFIGRKLPGVDISELEALPNTEFLGLMPQDKLPEEISKFDVCLNVFSENGLSKDVSPLKFYEYLATEKPVVSTPVPLQVRDFADCIYIAESSEDFTEQCRMALLEPPDSPKRALRRNRAKECSWDRRVSLMRSILKWDQEDSL